MKRRVRSLSLAALPLVVVSALLPACVAGAPEPPPRLGEPPAPLSEVKPPPPAPGMLWVPGAWHDDGVQYVWVPGRWESPRGGAQEP